MGKFKKRLLDTLLAIGIIVGIFTLILCQKFFEAAYVVFVEWLRYLIWS